MRSLFIDTSSFFVTLSLICDDTVLANYSEPIKDDMSSKILPLIRDLFKKVDFEIKDIDKIFVVNGPGSFTGIRIGVTIAKVIAWSLKKDIIPLSSLEFLATTPFNTDYIIPAIDAKRGYVYAGKYDKNLNPILPDKYVLYSDIDIINSTIVSRESLINSIIPDVDVVKIINKHKDDLPINPHMVNPNYLKLTEAEVKLKEKFND